MNQFRHAFTFDAGRYETRGAVTVYPPDADRKERQLQLALTAGPADFTFYPSPAEARELAAALLNAADTFDPLGGTYELTYKRRAVPVYPCGQTACEVCSSIGLEAEVAL